MARPTLDAATDAGSDTANSMTFAHVCSADADLLVVVAAGAGGSPSYSATYDGVAMTLLEAYTSHPNQHHHCALFYLVNPASGSNNVVVNTGGGSKMMAGAVSLEGVDTSDPVEDSGQQSETSGSSIGVTLATDEDTFGVSVLGTGQSGSTAQGSGETKFADDDPDQGFFDGDGTYKDLTSSDESFSRTVAINSRGASLLAAAFRGAAAGGGDVKAYSGVDEADAKTVQGVANANVSTWCGVDA